MKSVERIEGASPYKIDIAVLCIFFCREEQFKQVFSEVRKAKPSKLYLYQDGPREGSKTDQDGIRACRSIAEQIDWECEVHRWYQENNTGCDPSEYLSQKWMFSGEEMGIVLEDDDVPSQSFFPFCKELLEKYKNDTRIHWICGMNNCGVVEDIDSSYLFTQNGSCWGWATWKREIDSWDSSYSWINNSRDLQNLKAQFANRGVAMKTIAACEKHLKTGVEHYETIGGISLYLNNQLNIVPKYNMITNIGVSDNSTHSTDDIRIIPKRNRRLLNMKRYEIDFPLVHPKYVMADVEFERQMTPSKTKELLSKLEGVYLRMKYKGMVNTVKHYIGKRAKNGRNS